MFLYNKRRNLAEAEKLFQRVLSLNDEYVEALVDYAVHTTHMHAHVAT